MKKVALREKVTGPSEWVKSVQLRIAGVELQRRPEPTGADGLRRRMAGVRRKPFGNARTISGIALA